MNLNDFENLRKSISPLDALAKQQKGWYELMHPITAYSSALSGVTKEMDKFRSLFAVPDHFSKTKYLGSAWYEPYRSLADRFGENNLYKSFDYAYNLSALAESSISRFSDYRLGGLYNLDFHSTRNLSREFTSLSKAYSNIFEAISEKFIPNIDLLEKAPAAFLKTVKVFEAITVPEEDLNLVDEATEEHHADEIEQQLAYADPKYVKRWVAAIAAPDPANPESIRHFSVSLRELIRSVMHHYSPDKSVKQWSASSSDFHNNKPTRAARINYIFRHYNSPPMEDFIAKDLKATIEFVELVNRQTHQDEPHFTSHQINVVKLKAEQILIQMISAGRSNES